MVLVPLKRQCHKIFCFRFFACITFPQAPENNIRVIPIFSNIRGDIRKSRCTTRINDTGGKFAAGVSYSTSVANLPPLSTTTAANLPPVSTTLAANFATGTTGVVDIGGKFATGVNDTSSKFPTVSTTPVAYCHRYQRHRRQICQRCQQHRWQIMGTISGCRHLKLNLKAKIYIYVNNTPKVSKQNNENFSDWRFCPFATGVNDTGGAP